MSAHVRVRQSVFAEILGHALAEAPNECCGLLIGTPDQIVEAARARNLRASATAYLVEPADHVAAIRRARQEGLAVVGAYHSHPGSAATPSHRDTAEAAYSDFLYLIVGPVDGAFEAIETRAFRFSEAGPAEVALIAVP